MTPTAVTPAARRDRSATPAPDTDSRRAPAGRPSSLRSGRTPRTTQAPRPTQVPRSAQPQARGSARVERTTRPAPATATAARAAKTAPRAGVKQPPRGKATSRSTSKQAPKRSPQRASSARSAAHRPAIRTSATPRARRRISGPAGGIASLAVAGGYGTVTLPARTRRRPRALPRPSIRLPRPRLPYVHPPSPAALARGAVAFVASLPESSLLDRVIRGRMWIPLLGVLLVGIVGLQVENLKLNAGLGGAIEQTTNLQSRNDWLRDDVAQLSDPQRIEGIAARHGMLMAPPSVTKFLGVGGTPSSGAVRAAIAGIHAPGSAYFASPVGTLSAADAAAAPGSTTAPATAG
jgi:hypothetical protein